MTTQADVTRELRASRPLAPDALRESVRRIVTAEPPPRPAYGARLAALLPRTRRSFLVLVPTAAVAVALAAGLVQLARPDGPVAEVAAPAERARPEKSSATTSPSMPSAAATENGALDGLAQRGAPALPAAKSGAAASGLPAPAPDRAQRTSVSLALEVADADALSIATRRAISATRALGGYLVSVSYGSSTGGAATLVARVPSDRVQDAIAQLSDLGKLTSQSVQIDDLQASLDEVARQSAVLRRRIAAIGAQLDDPTLASAERARLEAARRSLRDELAGAGRSGRAIRGEAALATFQVEIRTAERHETVPAPPTRFDRAVDDAVGILAVEGAVLLYGLVLLGPLLLGASAVWLAVRGLGRRGRDRLLGAP